MEMHQIRYALEAARTLNFTRAAEHCDISQPALTKAVKALEGELGAQLFLREGNRVLLSDFGKRMMPRLQHVLDTAESVRDLAINYRTRAETPVNLGVMTSIGHARLSRFLSRFRHEHAEVQVSMSEAGVDELRAGLDAGQYDAVMVNPVGGFDAYAQMTLYDEPYIVILPPDHPYREKDGITLNELDGEPYVDRLGCEMRPMLLSACQAQDITLPARFKSLREDWVQAMVSAGMGVALMPELAVSNNDLIQRPLVDPRLTRQVCLVTMPGRPHSPELKEFIRAARQFDWPG
ncbi:LysR family transcriptional regulator [Oceanibium sediminis]|uniref:LysR family transcriptional regulator n=1 Tax=Oceanibium sediminis TaxID=2026339 RepID=UPI0018E56614|nr:LysR family transcriptional regulator [Oceanibium sediminis]